MMSDAVRGFFGRLPPRPPAQASPEPGVMTSKPPGEPVAPHTPVALHNAVRTPWPAARMALANQLWGQGFISPGGEPETLRLTRPLGISSIDDLLIVGVGSGGPASAVARNLGAHVTAMDEDPSLLAAARGLISRSHLTKQVRIEAWHPDNPALNGHTHQHCLALEPFHGARPEPILDGLAHVLKPEGHIVITELAAAAPLNRADPTVRRWAELEHRDPAGLMAPITVTRMLGRVGLDVRDAEDISQRHLDHAMLGWRMLLHGLESKPSQHDAEHLMLEAELWRLRRRLIKEGRLQMMRWHAISHSAMV